MRIAYAENVLSLYGNDTVDGGGAGNPPCTVPGVGSGVCILTSACAAMPGHVSTPNYCPGAADIECCTGPKDVAGTRRGRPMRARRRVRATPGAVPRQRRAIRAADRRGPRREDRRAPPRVVPATVRRPPSPRAPVVARRHRGLPRTRSCGTRRLVSRGLPTAGASGEAPEPRRAKPASPREDVAAMRLRLRNPLCHEPCIPRVGDPLRARDVGVNAVARIRRIGQIRGRRRTAPKRRRRRLARPPSNSS